MNKYLFASHGLFAEGTKSFLNVMCGNYANVYTLTAFLDEKSVEEVVKEKMKEIGDFDQLIIFCDLYGGSVAQEIYRQTVEDKRNIHIIAGYNLALVIDIIARDSLLSKEEIEVLIENNKQSTVYIDRVIDKTIEDDLF